jgi:hypothetical protein
LTFSNTGAGNTTFEIIGTGDLEVKDGVFSRVFVGDNGRVGIHTVTPAADFDVDGSVAMNIQTVSNNWNITDTDGFYTILMNSSTSAISVQLPLADNNIGRVLILKRTGILGAQITTQGGDTIDGAANIIIAARYDTYVLQSDGANWYVLSKP